MNFSLKSVDLIVLYVARYEFYTAICVLKIEKQNKSEKSEK